MTQQQPVTAQVLPAADPAKYWRHDLFDYDCNTLDCLLSIFLPAINAGIVSEDYEFSTCNTVCQYLFYPLLVPLMRNDIRHMRSIEGHWFRDIVAGLCFHQCAVNQMKKEVRY